MSDAGSGLKQAAVCDVVRSLYDHANLSPPTPDHTVTPLNAIVDDHNLLCLEITSLRRRSATEYLARQAISISMPDPDNDEPLAGFIYATARAGVILVDDADPIVRRRFSVAHELGHYVLHLPAEPDEVFVEVIPTTISSLDEVDESLDSRTSQDTTPFQLERSESQDGMELEANGFASELLMPADLIRTVALTYQRRIRGEDLVWRLATDFLVSRAAMRMRLSGLQLIAPPVDGGSSMISSRKVPTAGH